LNNKLNNLKIKKNLNERNLNSLSKEYFENNEQNYMKSPENKTIQAKSMQSMRDSYVNGKV
jgi:hypothetical protein